MASGKVGHGPCPQKDCTASACFSRSSGGKLKYTCTYCDSSGFADEGGKACKRWLSRIVEDDAPAPTPAPAPAPGPAPAPAPAPTNPKKQAASGLLLG